MSHALGHNQPIRETFSHVLLRCWKYDSLLLQVPWKMLPKVSLSHYFFWQAASGVIQVEALGSHDWQAEVPNGSRHLCGCTPSRRPGRALGCRSAHICFLQLSLGVQRMISTACTICLSGRRGWHAYCRAVIAGLLLQGCYCRALLQGFIAELLLQAVIACMTLRCTSMLLFPAGLPAMKPNVMIQGAYKIVHNITTDIYNDMH